MDIRSLFANFMIKVGFVEEAEVKQIFCNAFAEEARSLDTKHLGWLKECVDAEVERRIEEG